MMSSKSGVWKSMFVFGLCAVLPLQASQGRGGGTPPPPPAPAPVITLSAVPSDCYSGPGCLDPAFGTLGLASADIGGVLQGATAVAVQADGRIVVAGVTANATPQYDRRWVIGRFLPDGAVDTSFATNGFLNFDPYPGVSGFDQASQLIILADGKILVAGFGSGGGSTTSIVMRLTASGAFDASFGAGGKFTATPGGLVQDMVLQPDGKILIVEPYASQGFRLLRLNANGTVDTRFGTNGYRQILYASTGSPDRIALQSTGHIVVSGSTASSATANDFVVTRVSSSGAWDGKFGAKGFAVIDFLGFTDLASSLEIASDDSILLGGRACTTAESPFCRENMAFARLTATGAMSTSFGVGGRLTVDLSGRDEAMDDILLQADGRILFAGSSGPAGEGWPGLAFIGRLMPNGTPDSSFGAGGVTVTAGVEPNNRWMSMTINPDGLVSTVGSSNHDRTAPDTYRWLLGRYFR